jgi:hypothetical protein
MNKRFAFLLMLMWSVPACAQRLTFGPQYEHWLLWVPAACALGLGLLFCLTPGRLRHLGFTLLLWLGYGMFAFGSINTPLGLLGVVALVLAPWVLVLALVVVYFAYRTQQKTS